MLTGILRQQAADALFLVQTDLAEVRVPRADIESIMPGKASIMPQGLEQQLSRPELTDLMAFLQSLK